MTIASNRLQSSWYDNVSAILWPTYGMISCRVEHHVWMILCFGTII
jgi:hypothetical protein